MVRVIELDPGALDPQLQTISFVHHPIWTNKRLYLNHGFLNYLYEPPNNKGSFKEVAKAYRLSNKKTPPGIKEWEQNMIHHNLIPHQVNWWAAMDVNYKWKDTSKYILNAKIKPAVKVFLTKLFNHRVYMGKFAHQRQSHSNLPPHQRYPTNCTYSSHQYDPTFPYATPPPLNNIITQLYEFWDSPLAQHLRQHVMTIADDLGTTLRQQWTHLYQLPMLLTYGIEDTNKGIVTSTLIICYLWTINAMFVDRMKAFQNGNLTDNFNFFLPSNYVNRFNFYLYKEITTLDKHVTNKGYHGREAALMPVPRPNINKLSQPLRDAYKHTWCRNNKIAEIQQDKLVVNIIDPPTLMDLHTNPYITLDTG